MMNAEHESNPQQPPLDTMVVGFEKTIGHPQQQQQQPLFNNDDNEIITGRLPNGLISNNSMSNNNEAPAEKLKQEQQQQQQQSYSEQQFEPTIVSIPGLSPQTQPPGEHPYNNDLLPTRSTTSTIPLPTINCNEHHESLSNSMMTTIPLGNSQNQYGHQQVQANEFLSNLSFDNNSTSYTDIMQTSGLQQNATDNNSQTAATTTTTTTNMKKATISSPWQYNDMADSCYSCHTPFIPILQNKHHCRYCGYIFCQNCSAQRCMIPPSRIVVIPAGGKHVKSTDLANNTTPSFTPDPDPDGMLTYYGNTGTEGGEQLLYGKGLEQRIQLARQPLRVCDTCYIQLQPLQEELRNTNSNAVRYNYIDPAAPVRMLNSPVAFTLGHEIRKAAYTLNNLLPLPKRRVGAMLSSNDIYHPSNFNNSLITSTDLQQCREDCMSISPSLGDVDGVRIPAKLLEQAKGIAVLTVLKTGFGFAGGEVGTGLVVAKLPPLVAATSSDGSSPQHQHHPIRWSAPSAIGTAGLSWGALIGAQVSDHVFVLMTDAAVELMFNDTAPSIQLGADIGIAAGPLGRSVEGDVAMSANQPLAPIYTYSLSKGLYAGVSLDGKILVTRQDLNEKFYGHRVTAQQILHGEVPTPPAAQPLYDALARCHVYATNTRIQSTQRRYHNAGPTSTTTGTSNENRTVLNEYGEISDFDTFRIPNNGHGAQYL